MRLLLSFIALLFAGIISAQNPAVFEKREYNFAEGKVLPYRILYPENYDKSKKYPLVLFLHGAGERGNDNEKQLVHGSKLFLDPENRKKFPAIVIFPQCPSNSFWASITVDTTVKPRVLAFDYTREANWPLTAANELVQKVTSEEAVDQRRIYVAGLSMGGMGTFETVYRYPNLYAAALPICGGADLKSYSNWTGKTPFWIFHGDADPVVTVKLSRDAHEKLKSIKAKVKYTEYPGVNHNSWDSAFAEPAFLKWMFQQKKKK
jgi:predicted peptidase